MGSQLLLKDKWEYGMEQETWAAPQGGMGGIYPPHYFRVGGSGGGQKYFPPEELRLVEMIDYSF